MLPSPLRQLLLGFSVLLVSRLTLAAPALQVEVYNPGHEAIFPVTSVLVTGEKDAILVDAQFGKSQAEALLEKIRQSGKNLTTIYISHGDPDYYFGLQTITAAYPKAKVVATAPTVAHIKQTMVDKLAYWGPKLGNDAPSKLVLPAVLEGSSLNLEGQQLQVMGLDGPQPERTYVWIPSIKAVVGGVVLSNNIHVWMADTQTPQSHQDWLATLATIENLHATTLVPGHFLPGELDVKDSAQNTARYIRAFDSEAAKAGNASELIEAMKARYPTLQDVPSLELSAKVATGELKW